MKQYVVIGVGRFGMELIESLSRMNQQVLVIDSSEKIIQSINDRRLATYAVTADATNESVMRTLLCGNKQEKCEYDIGIVCIGENIEASILVSVILKEIGVPRIIAKVENDLHGKVLEKILHTGSKGRDEVIYPYRDIADLLATRLVRPNIQEELDLSADYKFMRITPPKSIIGKTIIETDLRKKYDINIIGIKAANNEKVEFSVKPGTIIKADDTILAVVPNNAVDKFLKEE